jgi:kinesin family protein 15
MGAMIGPDASQEATFERVGRKCVVSAMAGCNTTLLCYGQTSSGKTHTMFGDVNRNRIKTTNGYLPHPDWGMVPRIFESLLDGMGKVERHTALSITCNYIEIYEEKVMSLIFR